MTRRYIDEGVIGPKSIDDGYHLALATVSGCDYLVSWNYKHILALERRRKLNAVNVLQRYNPHSIYSPLTLLDRAMKTEEQIDLDALPVLEGYSCLEEKWRIAAEIGHELWQLTSEERLAYWQDVERKLKTDRRGYLNLSHNH